MATCNSRASQLFCLLLLVLCSLSQACKKVKLKVPFILHPGVLIAKVNVADCLISDHLIVRSNDPDFIAGNDGSLYARQSISMSSGKRTLTLTLADAITGVEEQLTVKLKHKNKIQSDTQQNFTILYSIAGPGVDQYPTGIFFIVPQTGEIKATRAVDREEFPEFKMIGYARTPEGYSPESPLIFVIKIEDDNDNAPQFTEESFCASLYEHSKAGTIVGRVNATDRDEPGTIHTLIRYSIISQFPVSPRLFAINGDTGIVTVTSQNTDRELNNEYVLLIKAQDMGGQPYSLSCTGTMTITIEDINDCAPTFTAASYQGEVNENEVDVVVLCIPIKDDDQVNTPNWRANFSIVQGNEDGKFQIVTNPETNEGCLRVIKPLNFEEKNRYQLQVGVTNEVQLISKSGSKTNVRNTVPVTVLVRDMDEGPEFMPVIWYARVKEGLPVGTLIYTCSAKDPETKTSDGISYKKLTDPFSWVTISSTCQITTAKILDRESSEVRKGSYNVTVLATDQSGKTGNGTLIITVDDVNDNMPNITKTEPHMCLMGKRSITIEAQDLDDVPNSAPLKFSLDDGGRPDVQSKWRITQLDGTSMTLEDIANQPAGAYVVLINIVDQQGKGQTHSVPVDICDCPDGINCPSSIGRRAAGEAFLGPLGILTLILPAILVGLLLCTQLLYHLRLPYGFHGKQRCPSLHSRPFCKIHKENPASLVYTGQDFCKSYRTGLLLTCLCGGAAAGDKHSNKGFPDDLAQQNLIVSNTEAPGEEVMDANFKVPIHITNANVSGQAPSGSGTFGHGVKTGGQQTSGLIMNGQQNMETIRTGHQTMETLRSGHQSTGSIRGGHYLLDPGKYSYAEWQNFMHSHLGEKVYLCGQDEEHQRTDDYVLPYNYEGRGSAAGSVGCCSDIQGEDERIEFSKTLEPKFRTLADICTKK